MHVVPAGVHGPRHRRGIGEPRGFRDGEGVHVRTGQDYRPGAVLQHAHHSRAAEPEHPEPESGELLLRQAGRPVLFEAQLRVPVQVLVGVPDPAEFAVESCQHFLNIAHQHSMRPLSRPRAVGRSAVGYTGGRGLYPGTARRNIM